MSNTSIKIWLVGIIAVALAIIVAAAVLLPRQGDNQLNLLPDSFSGDEEDVINVSGEPILVTGGTVSSSDNTNDSTSILTAVADDGYEFGYWINASSNKISGDESIKVNTSAKANFTPVFIAEANVIEITSQNSLGALESDISSGTTSGKMYRLMNDITLTSTSALGTFQGVLDGNGKKLYGLNISSSSNAGLFTSLEGAVIKNLIISSGSINTTGTYAGSFAATISDSLLSRCVSYISVSNTASAGIAGGIVGASTSTTAKSMLYCCGNYGSIWGATANSILGSNTQLAAGGYSCNLFRNFNNGGVAEA